jgi:peptidoglycan hydrolase-like protein with peptidoglycan-binding domain
MPAARIAKSLGELRAEVDALAPGRRKDSDDWICDAAHASRQSEHNPDENGVVRALDITHDPAQGVDSYRIAETLRQNQDKRILYVISNGRIFNSRVFPWGWRIYPGQNPHTHHVHVSVVEDPALYDDTTSWGIALAPAASDQFISARPRIKEGDSGAAVSEGQHLLGVPVTGSFGPETTAATRRFQAAHNLEVDGIIGPYTWDALLGPGAGPSISKRQSNITATVIGGPTDQETSVYDGHVIERMEHGVALPCRFNSMLPEVRVTNPVNGKSVVCNIVDVGPWNIDDPYWTRGTRPQAESGMDNLGRPTNGAGIDLTTAAAQEIGIVGKGKVDWEFIDGGREESVGDEPRDFSATLKQTVDRWENTMADLAQQSDKGSSTDNATALPENFQAIAKAIQQQQLSQDKAPTNKEVNISDVVQAVIAALASKAVPLQQQTSSNGTLTAAPVPVLTSIDKMLGGEWLAGKKTLIAAIAFTIQLIVAFSGFPTLAPAGGTVGNILTTIIGAFGGLGMVSKVDRVVQLLGVMAANSQTKTV